MDEKPKNGIFQRLTSDAWRFALVGCLAWGTDFLIVFQILTRWYGVDPVAAQPVCRLCGGLVSFTLNKFWTFRHRKQQVRIHTQFVRYWVVWLITLTVSVVFIALFYKGMELDKQHSKLLADSIAGLLSFFILRHWTFR